MLDYKGYHGKVEFDEKEGIFHGEVMNIRDVVTFQSKTEDEIEKSFQESVDDYLEFCNERNEDPDRPFSGRLMLRLPTNIHRQVYLKAKLEGKSLNDFITEKLSLVD